mgnify:CR=1 FL=1
MAGLLTFFAWWVKLGAGAYLAWHHVLYAPAQREAEWELAKDRHRRFSKNLHAAMKVDTEGDFVKEPTGDTPMTDAEEDGYWKTIDLPSGAVAKIEEGTADTHFRAQRAARDGQGLNETNYQKALITQLVEIGGDPLSEDELGGLPLPDFFALQQAFDELMQGPT